jgi:hypothetical protein
MWKPDLKDKCIHKYIYYLTYVNMHIHV